MKIESTYPSILLNSVDNNTKVSNEESKREVDFSKVLLDAVNKTNTLQNNSETLSEKLVMGEIDNIHDVTIANQKAELALELTVSVTNKMINAYKEIMRLQL